MRRRENEYEDIEKPVQVLRCVSTNPQLLVKLPLDISKDGKKYTKTRQELDGITLHTIR